MPGLHRIRRITLIMAAARSKLSTKFDGSVFYHILENEDIEEEHQTSPEEQVQDRNFRDLIHAFVDAAWYVHCLVNFKITFAPHPSQYLVFEHFGYMPLVDDELEETMLGVFHPDFYLTPDFEKLTRDQIYNGYHLQFDETYINKCYKEYKEKTAVDEDFWNSYYVNKPKKHM